MRERPLIYDCEYLSLRGDRDRMVIEFKGDDAILERQKIHHAAVGEILKVDPSAEHSIIRIRAIAILKGRGIKIRVVNPMGFRRTSYMINAVPPMEIGAAMLNDHEIPAMEETMYQTLTIDAKSEKWIDGFLLSAYFEDWSIRSRYEQFEPNRKINYLEIAILTWFRDCAPPDARPTKSISTCISWCLDGLTENLCTAVKPKEQREQFALALTDMNHHLLPNSDHDSIHPINHDKTLLMIKNGPSARKMMRKGGIKKFIELCTGTSCKTMVRTLAPYVTSIPPRTAASMMVNDDFENEWARSVRIDLFNLKPLMTKLTIDHRVRLAELLSEYLKTSRYFPIGGIQGASTIIEFFTIGDHTKIIDKCFEAIGIYKKMELLDEWDQHQELPPEEQAYAAQNWDKTIDPFQAMIDAGSQLRRWRKATLNKKQQQMFPEGIKIKSRWNSIKEIHDDISKQANKLEALENMGLMPWMENFKNIHGLRCGPVRILLPRTNQTLVRWGKEQGHCVGSMYNRYMQKNECIIAGVFIGPELKYCIRLVPVVDQDATQRKAIAEAGLNANVVLIGEKIIRWELVEFRGKGNCWPDANHAAYVVEALDSAGHCVEKWPGANGFGAAQKEDWAVDYSSYRMEAPEVTLCAENTKNFMQEKPVLTARTGSDNV